MAVWAYPCRPCEDVVRDVTWYVAAAAVAELPPGVEIVRVKVGRDWRCARLDRNRREEVEGLLVREVLASSSGDCPECGSR